MTIKSNQTLRMRALQADLMSLSGLPSFSPHSPLKNVHKSQALCLFLQEAVRLRSNYADAFTGMGVSLKELGRKEEAVACLQQVVRLRPHCALSLGNLAGIDSLHFLIGCSVLRG